MSPRTLTRTPIVALVLLSLLTSACGARWTDEQKVSVQDRNSSASGNSVAEGDTSGSGTTRTTRPSGGAGGTAVASGGGASSSGSSTGAGSGSGGADAGSQGSGAQGGGGPLPCAAPSDATGVTAGELRVGSISALTGPVPGLGASSAAAARAYVAYRNATGGVCGREVVLTEVDDGTDIGRYRSIVSDLSAEVLGIAGGFTIGDVGGTDVVAEAGLPVVNIPSAESVQVLPTAFDINPPFPDLGAVIGKYRYLREQGASKVSLVYLAVESSRAEANVQKALMQAAGLEIVEVQELPISTLSFDSAARSVANSGADYFFFIGDQNSNSGMARAVADSGYDLAFAEYFTFSYGTDFIERAGAATAEGALSWIRTLPNEEAGQNPEMAAFVEWMERVAPSDVKDVFAADSWASSKAFFDALEALPGPISREALASKLSSIDTFDAGGMLGPIRLGAEQTQGCVIAMQVQGGAWKRLAPAQGFLC